ncbi:ParA family protein [Desulfovibrio sp. JC010]|uniref:ParA family protein n=1 Tax=Desulfovibrio sp. JC010 TaxID=2593641 RepID=UPI0013D358D0|nr:ParA family protein [Desulfovibrio sp. JC010]NDV28572.1 ParA family protein [Desulfovibrio sp. JC010]
MKIITMLAQKGGTGKTTLSIHLAAVAAGGNRKVVIADTDPQGSSSVWSERRSKILPEVHKYTAQSLKKDIEALTGAGTEFLIIDTPPHSTENATIAASMADFIVIPSRPAILDLAAIGDSVSIANKVGKPGAIVLNCCPPPTRYGETAIVQEAREALETYGMNVAPTAISQRAAFSHALIDGRTVTEFEAKGKAAGEVRTFWKWLKKELDRG